jgi:hypothetical protein
MIGRDLGHRVGFVDFNDIALRCFLWRVLAILPKPTIYFVDPPALSV